MATLSSILAYRIPWTEEPGGLQVKNVIFQRLKSNGSIMESELVLPCNTAICGFFCLFCFDYKEDLSFNPFWVVKYYAWACVSDHFSLLG